ncbi:MAG: hypothetical protein Q7U20_04270 [Caulobacter sp.]|nr:hypothetical protein [Caulobacter sp.]
MFKSIVSVASVIATVSIAASAMAGPITPKTFQPGPVLPAGATLPGFTLGCVVDPAIVSVTLTKGARRGQVRISYVITNAGSSAWRSGANQQGAHLRAVNGNTGGVFASDRPLPGSAGAGAVMQRFTSPMINNAFDDFEFGGHLELAITYDPDILIDGNRCNDDANADNNTLRIENGDILAFMNGAATSRTFR